MFKHILVLATCFTLIGLTGCDSDSGGDDNPMGSMEALVDGSQWTAANATATKVGAAGFVTVTIAGSNTAVEVMTVSLLNVTAPGTYDLGGINLASMSWTPGSVPVNEVYNAQSGSVTITSIDDDEVVGTYAFEGMRLSDNGTVSITSGSFDVEYGPGISVDAN